MTARAETIRAAWPAEFDDGARCGFSGNFDGPRELGALPREFHSWPLERRNAWYAGFNKGRCDSGKEELRFDRRAAGQPRPRIPVPCPSWIDPKWWEREWRAKPDTFTDYGWANALCTNFNKIDKRGCHG